MTKLKTSEKIEKVVAQTTKTIDGLRNSMYTLKEVSVKHLVAINSAGLNIEQTMSKLAPLNDKLLQSYQKTNKAALEALNAEIATSKTKTNALNKLVEAHKAKDLALRKQHEIEQHRIAEEYKEGIEKAKLSADQMVAVEEDKAKRIAQIDAQLKKDLELNATDLQANVEAVRANMLNELTKETQETIKHTNGLWKGVIDVSATSKQYDEAIKALNDYKTQLQKGRIKIADEYDKQIEEARLNDAGVTALADEKLEALRKYDAFETEEVKRVGAEIAKLEKSSQALRLQQWQAYAKNYQALSTKIKDTTKIATDAAKRTFTELSTDLETKVIEIGNELTKLETQKGKELLSEEDKNAKEQELKQAKTDKDNATTEEQRLNAEKRINLLGEELSKDTALKEEFISKEEKLKKEKEKAEKQKKLADKINKKAELAEKIVTATADIAAGVTKSLALGPFIGPIMAAMVGAMGAVQLAVMAKQFAKLEDGGLLSGKRHSQGGMPILGSNIEVEGGEYVVNRQSTGKNLGLLRYINEQRRELDSNDMHAYFSTPLPRFIQPEYMNTFERGGQVPILPMSNNMDTQQILDAIGSINFQPHVSVTDINRMQKQMTLVDDWVGMK